MSSSQEIRPDDHPSYQQMDSQTDFTTTDDNLSAERPRYAKKSARRLFSLLMKQKGKLFIVLIAVIFSCAASLAAPMVIGEAINQIFDGLQNAVRGNPFKINFETMGGIILLLFALYLVSNLFVYLQQYIMASVSQTLVLDLRKDLAAKLSRLPLKFYDTRKIGDILSRTSNDLEKVGDTLQEGMMQFITTVVTIIGAVALMLSISPVLTLIALVMIILGVVITGFISEKSHRLFTQNQQTLGEFNGQIEEFFTGQMVIKAFSREPAAIETIAETNERLFKASRNAQFITYAINPAIRLMNQIGYVLIAILGGIFVIQGRLSLGVIQAFFQYVNQASEPVTEAAYIYNAMQAAVASAERVFEILDETEAVPDPQKPLSLSAPKGHVRFEHVRFGYTPDSLLMEDISLDARPGQKIAIVGPTGAGKTTLINLLMRFYEINGGAITIDGVSISDLTRSELRSCFGMVLQDTWLFGGTIAENIAYGKPDATLAEIIEAAKAARCDHFIRTLPKGYDTVLDNDGGSISQGQKQLLTIARVILADPSILILDEATSSVDTRTELMIQHAMDTLMQGRTSFIIAHRLSTIVDADCILVMNQGTIIEQGDHQTLLEQGGFYASLYNSQFAEN